MKTSTLKEEIINQFKNELGGFPFGKRLEQAIDLAIRKTQETDNKIIEEMVKENEHKFRTINELQSKIKEQEKCGYKEGYLEAISDLNRGFYEQWIEQEKGDFKIMAQGIIELKSKIKEMEEEIKEYKEECIDSANTIIACVDENEELKQSKSKTIRKVEEEIKKIHRDMVVRIYKRHPRNCGTCQWLNEIHPQLKRL